MKPENLQRLILKWPPPKTHNIVPLPPQSKSKIQEPKIKECNKFSPIRISALREQQVCDFEIFAYCSKNYQDAYDFVIDSWTRLPNMKKVTLYTDWDFKPNNDKVVVKHMFDESSDWLTGTGRRLNVIKDFSELNKTQEKNVLFMDIDCYIVRDVSEIFTFDFDMGITRLDNGSSYTNKTATAGLWFCKLSPGYYNFINDWFVEAEHLKSKKIGTDNHKISYVQYSFTTIAKRQTSRYKVLSIDEKIYNSEHSDLKKWYDLIQKFKPKILHFKGRRFRDASIVSRSLELSKG
jgi:hypothetical protein